MSIINSIEWRYATKKFDPNIPFCIIHPGARKYDQWQFEKFAEIVGYFFEHFHLGIILTCGPGQLEQVEKLDLRKNFLGDKGLDVLISSEKIVNVRELDLRNNQITRVGMVLLSKTKNLMNLESLDLRVNKLGRRWEDKLKEQGNFPNLTKLRIA